MTAPEADAVDLDLAHQARAGAPGAVEALALRYRSRIYAFALTMLRDPDEAEDVAQETLVRTFASLRSYRAEGAFRSWVFRIAANLCRDRLRKNRHRDLMLDAADLPHVGESAAELCEQLALRTAVFTAVQRLPLTYRAPVVLHYMEGLSIAETAAALRRSKTAVRVQLWRARNMLAQELAEWQKEELP